MLRLAVDLRPLLEPFESGVTQYTKAVVNEFLLREDVELDLYYQARTRCQRIHDLYPNVRHIAISNTHFHFKCLFGFPSLPKDFFEEKPELIWIPDRRPFYRCSIPLVMTIHDKVPELYRGTLSIKGKLWHRLFSLKRLLSLCSGLLVPTFTVAGALNTQLPKEVTYEGARLQKSAAPKGVKKFKAAPFFLMISPSDPRKRIEWLLAMADRFPRANFIVVGLKDADARFAELKLEQKKNVMLLGEVSEGEKAWFLRNAVALLALSKYEGFDLPVLEAVQAKCSVIMSDIAVHNELYKKACFVKDLHELETAIYRALEGKVQVPLLRGQYTWAKTSERSLLFFLRVLLNEDRKRGSNGNRHDHSHHS